jgi:hypothetical protein
MRTGSVFPVMAVLTLSGAAALSAPACGGNTAPHTTGGGDSGNGDDGMQMVMEGGVTDDGGSDAAPGAPITAPNETWTWVPFDDARCMNDTPTGLGVNITNKSDKLAIFLMGGGACWDSLTVALGTCANLSGYGDANFMSDIGKYGTAGMFDRSDPDNPFKDYSFVFAPYCSGDVFSGSNPKAADGEKHVGYDNVTAYLKRIVPTFPHPSILALTGSSAGGLGVMMNMPQVAQAFGPSVNMVALDDAAVVMGPTYLTPSLQTATDAAWQFSQHFPADCPMLKVGALHEVYGCLAQKYPKVRIGIYGTQGDSTMRGFYGYGLNPPGQMSVAMYTAGLNDVSMNLISPFSQMHNYWAPGTTHTFLGQSPLGQTVVKGVKITDWIRGLIDGTSAFADVSP